MKHIDEIPARLLAFAAALAIAACQPAHEAADGPAATGQPGAAAEQPKDAAVQPKAAVAQPNDAAAQPEDAATQPEVASEQREVAAAAGTPPSTEAKPGAPIDIRYKVIGTALVGQPLSVEIDVSSRLRDRPIELDYRIIDPRDLAFGKEQPQHVSMSAIGDAPSALRQVTVVPQREGRLYLNVSAQVETEQGTMIKAIAIPIQVGTGSKDGAVNGKLKKDADGDTVVSMPAEEN